MLKVAPPANNVFDNFKCGEVFCISSAVFNITCCLCAVKIPFDEFPSHFQLQHLALVEKSINLEELESKDFAKAIEDVTILDNVTFKEEDVEDPIKDEFIAEDTIDKNNTLQLLEKTEKTQKKLESLEQCFPIEEKIDDKTVQESSIKKTRKPRRSRKKTNDAKAIQGGETEISPALDEKIDNDINVSKNITEEASIKKTKTRKPRRSKKKTNDDKEIQGGDVEISVVVDDNTPKKSEEEVNEDDYLKDIDNDDDMDADWTQEDNKASESEESEDENKDNFKVELTEPCPICERLFRNKYGVLKHTQIVHNPKKPGPPKEPKYKCAECNQGFRTARDLNGHRWKHTGIFCDVCGKKFSQPGNMIRHKQRHTGIKDFKCEECGKAFFTDKELKSHVICHTGLMPCICEICGKQCRHRGVLTAHMRRHTGERPAKCNVCGKCFFSIHDLNIHAVAHTSERPFKCDICGSTFQRRKALRVHKLIHSKDRKHVCTICGKGFAQSGGLKAHMRSHDTAIQKSIFETAQQALVPSLTLANPAVSGLDLPTFTITSEVSMPIKSSELEEFMA